MGHRFGIRRWAAFAPGLDTHEAWRAWARAPWLPQGDEVPALQEMPAMARRRVERLGRIALQCAWRCQDEGETTLPLVFGSRHGDIGRTHAMLEALARDEPLSPTHFGLSTHNAIAAQYSIARGLTASCSVVASGARTAEAVVMEAVALLADGADEVLAVMYDQPPPAAYDEFADEPAAPYAWALRLALAGDGDPAFGLECSEESPDAVARSAGPALPGGLATLRFLLDPVADVLELPDAGGGGWRWRRDG